jgi:hypothetical protein
MNNTPQETIKQNDALLVLRAKLGCLLEALNSKDRETRLNNMPNASSFIEEAIQLTRERQAIGASQSEPVAEIVEHEYLNGHIKMIKPLSEAPVGTKLYAAPQQSPIPQGWKPTDDEILEFAANEELFLFANHEDLMAIANGVIELIQLRINKLSAAPSAPIEAQQSVTGKDNGSN